MESLEAEKSSLNDKAMELVSTLNTQKVYTYTVYVHFTACWMLLGNKLVCTV